MFPTMYASFLKRFAAFLVDWLISSMIAGLLFVPLLLLFIPKFLADSALTGLFTGHGFDLEELLENSPGLFLAPLFANILIFVLIFFTIGLFYFAIFESGPRQATPGKMLLGLFVTDLQGRRISFPRALGRTLGKVLSKMFCYFGFLMALFTERSQALHDMMAGTLVLEPVVPAPPAGPPAPPADFPGSNYPTPAP